eukprot:SAG31_NODE_41892_length_274_cov_0.582857_1_plen_21_part_01
MPSLPVLPGSVYKIYLKNSSS